MRMKCAALLAAGLSTAAFAQEEDVVMLYGRIFLTAASSEATGGSTPLPARTVIGDQASLLGVRSIENLGGDVKGFVQIETSFRADSNNGAFADRNSAVGLQGTWGTVLIGRWDSPFKVATLVVDAYGDLTPSGFTGVLDDLGNFHRRVVNIVQYWSPNMGGMVFRYADKARNTPDLDLEPRVHAASLRLSRAGIYAFAAWEAHETRTAREKGVALGGTYLIGPWKLGGQYQKFDKTNLTDTRAWMANAIFTLGRSQFIGQYMRSKGGAAYGALQPDCNSWSVAYQYIFSSRTSVMASYVRVDNNEKGICNLGGGNALPIQPGQDPRSFWAGIAHLF